MPAENQATDLQLTLYGSPVSTFVCKVQLLLEYKSVPYRIEMPDRETLLQLNPLGKIPVLRDGNNVVVDSSVICDYLDRRFPQWPVYPVDPYARSQALWLEEYADSALQECFYPFVREALFNPKLYGQPTDIAVMEQARTDASDRLDYLERVLDGNFLVGGLLSIADLTLAAVLINPLQVGFLLDAGRWPKLSAYIKNLFAREPFASRIKQSQKAIEEIKARRPD